MEPDDILTFGVMTWDDFYVPELAEAALTELGKHEDWELQVFISATAIYAANFLNPN